MGTHLTKLLSAENLDCTLIDADKSRLSALDSDYDLMTIAAPTTSIKALKDAGVNGADQNTIIADTAVQYQGLTIHASNTQTITGNQNMNSAKSIQINISLVKTLVFSQRQHPLSFSEILFFIPVFRIVRSFRVQSTKFLLFSFFTQALILARRDKFFCFSG